jgi:hypothetical protein
MGVVTKTTTTTATLKPLSMLGRTLTHFRAGNCSTSPFLHFNCTLWCFFSSDSKHFDWQHYSTSTGPDPRFSCAPTVDGLGPRSPGGQQEEAPPNLAGRIPLLPVLRRPPRWGTVQLVQQSRSNGLLLFIISDMKLNYIDKWYEIKLYW